MTVKVTYILRISGRHVDKRTEEIHESMRESAKIGGYEPMQLDYWLPDICHEVIIEGKDFTDCDEQMRVYTKAFREKDVSMNKDNNSFRYSYEVMPTGCKND